jgi:hypothetical protein
VSGGMAASSRGESTPGDTQQIDTGSSANPIKDLKDIPADCVVYCMHGFRWDLCSLSKNDHCGSVLSLDPQIFQI